MRFEGTSTRVPVFGLRPTRGWRWRVRKLPNPRISILSPPRKERTMLSKIASTITSESFRVISTTRDTSSISSAFVILFLISSASPCRSPRLLVLPFRVHHFFDGHRGRGRLALIFIQARFLLVVGESAQTQPDLLFRFIHFDDLEIELLADRQWRIFGVAAVRRARHLRAMAQALDARSKFHKHSEIRRAAYPSPNRVSHLVSAEDRFPRIRLKLFHAERKPAVPGVDIQNHRLHQLAFFQNFGRMLHALGPR